MFLLKNIIKKKKNKIDVTITFLTTDIDDKLLFLDFCLYSNYCELYGVAMCVKKNARKANDVMLQFLMMSTGSYFLVVFDGCVYKGCSLVVSMFHCIIIDERKQFK